MMFPTVLDLSNTHLKRRFPCNPVTAAVDNLLQLQAMSDAYEAKEFGCNACHKRFNSASSRSQHKKSCKAPAASSSEPIPAAETSGTSTSATSHGPCGGVVNNTNVHNATTTIDNSHRTIIVVNSLGRDPAKWADFMLQCVRQPISGVCDYIEHKHFDPAVPENHNIRKPRKKTAVVDVLNCKEWKSKASHEVIDDLFRFMRDDFVPYINGELKQRKTSKLRCASVENFIKSVASLVDWYLDYEFDEDEPDPYETAKSHRKAQLYNSVKDKLYECSQRLHDERVKD